MRSVPPGSVFEDEWYREAWGMPNSKSILTACAKMRMAMSPRDLMLASQGLKRGLASAPTVVRDHLRDLYRSRMQWLKDNPRMEPVMERIESIGGRKRGRKRVGPFVRQVGSRTVER